MPLSPRLMLVGLAGAALLAGCNQADKADPVDENQDPAMQGALGDQIMVDPDLSGQNGAAVSAEGGRTELPPEQRGPQAIAAARQDAVRKAGGRIENAPQPSAGGASSLVEDAATAAQVAQASKAASTDCASKAQYAMGWASKLPASLAVYPRAAVQEAAGVDGGGCALNVVNFVTPVEIRDVVNYYYTTARKDGYDAHYRMDGADHVLGGAKGGKAYVLYARARDDGLTEVDLIASGK